MTQVKKLSVATVFGKIPLKDLAAKGQITVMIAVGTAIGIKSGQSNFGEWRALQGQFRAVHPETGETFDGPTLFLPDIAMVPIEVALANSRGVEFAVKIICRWAADDPGRKPGGVPYEYTWEPLIDAVEDNPLDRIMSKVNQKLLPAPIAAAQAKAKDKAKAA